MDETTARDIAHRSHHGQTTRHGLPLTEHIERVAAAVPDIARAVALLHDVLEKSDTRVEELRERGLTPDEFAALDLLTRRGTESFERHTLRIADADGPSGLIARIIKRADLEDHLGQADSASDAPPYSWAWRHTLAAQVRRGEVDAGPPVSASRNRAA